MYAGARVCTNVYAHICEHMWNSKVDTGWFLQFLSPLFIEARSLAGPRVPQFQPAFQVVYLGSSASASRVLRWQVVTTLVLLGPHICTSVLSTASALYPSTVAWAPWFYNTALPVGPRIPPVSARILGCTPVHLGWGNLNSDLYVCTANTWPQERVFSRSNVELWELLLCRPSRHSAVGLSHTFVIPCLLCLVVRKQSQTGLHVSIGPSLTRFSASLHAFYWWEPSRSLKTNWRIRGVDLLVREQDRFGWNNVK